LYHRLHSSTALCCNDDQRSQWENGDFDCIIYLIPYMAMQFRIHTCRNFIKTDRVVLPVSYIKTTSYYIKTQYSLSMPIGRGQCFWKMFAKTTNYHSGVIHYIVNRLHAKNTTCTRYLERLQKIMHSQWYFVQLSW